MALSDALLPTLLAACLFAACGSTTTEEQEVGQYCDSFCSKYAKASCDWQVSLQLRGDLLSFLSGTLGCAKECQGAFNAPHCVDTPECGAWLKCLGSKAQLKCEPYQYPLQLTRVLGCDDQAIAFAEVNGMCFVLPSLDSGSCSSDTPFRYYCSQTSAEFIVNGDPPNSPACKPAEPGFFCCPDHFWEK